MRAVRAADLDSVASYKIVEIARPAPGPGELLVRISYCGIGYADALMALGRYQVKPSLPFIPASEIAGIVEAVGADVRNFSKGDRVMAALSGGGGFADYAVVAATSANQVPEALDLPSAAALRINYLTAIHALTDRGQLAKGETLLVLGAAGGLGTAAIQLGKALGATVIAVASSAAKRKLAQSLGADQVLDTDPEDWRTRLRALCGGRGPDVVFDPVCGPLFEPAFRSLHWRGRHLVLGFVGGPIPALRANLPLMKGAALIGVDLRQYLEFERAGAATHMENLLRMASEGFVHPVVQPPFPFDAYAAALERAQSGEGSGKVVLAVNEDQ